MMNITLNGEKSEIAERTALSSLITDKCPNPKCVIAEVNEMIIKRDNWESHSLKNGDQIELITFVGGG